MNEYILMKDSKILHSEYYEVSERNIEGFKSQFFRFMPKNKDISILDIGCGAGQLLYVLRSEGYTNIFGIDTGKEQVELTKQKGIQSEQITDLEAWLSSHRDEFDVITLAATIEHFPKDKIFDYLNAMKSALKKGGILIVTTGNMSCLTGLFIRYVDMTHAIGFTDRALIRLGMLVGFSDVKVYGERLPLKARPKYLVWIILRRLHFSILKFLMFLEKGTDAPKIVSRDLILIARK